MDEYKSLYEKSETAEQAFIRLAEILKVLRKECLWDKAQTHESLRICLLEEAYEVCEAIDNNNMENLEEELGDILLQVLFHSALAEESKEFDLISVINRECGKMIRRHPHVFLKESVKSVDKAIEKWENMKWKEKEDASYRARLESVPKALPALIRSYKLQKKAAEAGFDWDDSSGAFLKVKEETEELAAVIGGGDERKIKEELGDLLFSVVNLARFLNVNPEQALNATSDKFVKRFAFIESEADSRGIRLNDMTLAEMDGLWEEAKQREKCR